MTLTSSELIVLGLVIEQPRHGYDIEQTIAERGIRQWTDLAFSSIYYVLAKLEHRALVEAAAADGPKARRIFTVTDAGRAAAASAAAEAIADATPAFSPFVVGLANVSLVDAEQVRNRLCERARAIQEHITAVERARAAQGELPQPARLVFSYTLAMLSAERVWLTTIEKGDEFSCRPTSRSTSTPTPLRAARSRS